MNRRERRAAQKRGQGVGAQGIRNQGPPLPPAESARLFAEAVAYRQQGALVEAEAICSNILAANPNHAGSLFMLGTIAMQLRHPDIALEWISQAVASDSRNAAYHNEMGLALQALGRVGDAIACYRRAVRLEPDNSRGYNNLAVALQAQGSLAEASAEFAMALERTPELFDNYPDVSATLLKLNPILATGVARTADAWPRRLSIEDLFGPNGYSAVSGDPLLRCMLVSSPIRNIALEWMSTSVRSALLKSAINGNAGDADESDLNFRCALARQCFINEYIFATTPDELDGAERLKQSLIELIEAKAAVPPRMLAAVASYFALDTIANAAVLLDRTWPAAVDELLTQQLREPAEEMRIREAIPRLTAIEDATSLLVRQQYEENPYPRWVLPPSERADLTLTEYLNRNYPSVPLLGIADTGGVDILIAGCGTGRHPILMAQIYKGARVFAIDLSLASLAYAQRKSRELGVENISYAQADILTLGSLGRTFDLIDSSGVLHHLADPVAGWLALVALVRRNGFMRIGLYSELARRDVGAARVFCAERGFRPMAEDIRAARQELMNTELKSVIRYNDFFSTSECRDLLFHVQEHRFTIPHIREFLGTHGLRFIGFDLPKTVHPAYCKRFPDDPAMVDLGHWHTFETEQPNTFAGMYQFWVQKQ